MVLSVFFGLGLVLLTVIQKRPSAAQAGLDSYLFGQAAALLRVDVIVTTVLGSVALLVLMLGWKQFKLLSSPTRLDILQHICEEEKTVSTLVELTGCKQALTQSSKKRRPAVSASPRQNWLPAAW